MTRTALTPYMLIRGMFVRMIAILPLAAIIGGAVYMWSVAQIPLFKADVQLVYVAPPEGQDGNRASSFAGVSSLLGGSAQNDDKNIALATLRSREFLTDFIQRRGLVPLIYASLWDGTAGRWKVARDRVPTLNEAAETLRGKYLKITDDSTDGTIHLVLNLPDKKRVAPLANEIVQVADGKLRQRSQIESGKNLKYLRTELTATGNAELRESITRVMERELHRRALAQTGTHYALQVIDPAVEPRRAAWPKPLLYSVAAFFLMVFAGCAVSALLDMRRVNPE